MEVIGDKINTIPMCKNKTVFIAENNHRIPRDNIYQMILKAFRAESVSSRDSNPR